MLCTVAVWYLGYCVQPQNRAARFSGIMALGGGKIVNDNDDNTIK